MAMLSSKPGERHRVLSYISHALRDVKEKDPAKDVPITWEYGKASALSYSSRSSDSSGASDSTDRTSVQQDDSTTTDGVTHIAKMPLNATSKHTPEAGGSTVIDLFVERCEDYKANVIRVSSEEELPAALALEVQSLGLQSLVIPPGINPSWLDGFAGTGLQIVLDAPPLSKKQLATAEGVLTASALGIAETGTIALDHRANQGRRIITLLPPAHLCVVSAADIVGSVPEAVQLLKPAFASGNPLTWISGPSATVDIEFTRVEGVHGPHQLSIFVVG